MFGSWLACVLRRHESFRSRLDFYHRCFLSNFAEGCICDLWLDFDSISSRLHLRGLFTYWRPKLSRVMWCAPPADWAFPRVCSLNAAIKTLCTALSNALGIRRSVESSKKTSSGGWSERQIYLCSINHWIKNFMVFSWIKLEWQKA